MPAVIRRPGDVKPRTVSSDMVSGLDWFPTLLAAAIYRCYVATVF